MSYQLDREQLLKLARLGAKQRLEERRNEQKAIEALVGRGSANGQLRGAAARPRTRRRMSAAARRAVSERMKKYWAARKKAGR